jgi:hypothetical protein
VIHYGVHFGLFITQGKFLLVGLLLFFHFLILVALIKIFATDRGIIVPIVKNVHMSKKS